MSAKRKSATPPGPNEDTETGPILDLEPEAPETILFDETPVAGTATNGDTLGLPQPPARRGTSVRGILFPVIALLAGTLAGGWLYRDYLSAYLPTDGMTTMATQIATLHANLKAEQEQRASLAAFAEQLKANIDQVEQGHVELGRKNTATTQETLNRLAKVDSSLTETSKRIDALKSSFATRGAGTTLGQGIDPAILSALDQRLASLEKDMATLKSTAPTHLDPAELDTALTALTAKVGSGAPYTDEYATIARLVPASDGLDILAANAKTGLPNAKTLAQELATLLPTLPGTAAAPASANDGYLDWFLSLFDGMIKVKTRGETDWQLLAQQAVASADAGKLQQAVDAIDTTGMNAPAVLVEWRNRVASRVALDTALQRVTAAVDRQRAALSGTKG